MNDNYPGLISSGTRRFGEDAYTEWWQFQRSKMTRPEIKSLLQTCLETTPYYGGPGRPYQDAPRFKVTRRRILVIIRGGWDI